MAFDLDGAIRRIKDFPKPGILFYDITSIIMNPEAFAACIDQMKELYKNEEFDVVAAIEARGFVFAAPFARELGKPLLLIRKKGKLPGKTLNKRFSLEYGEDEIQVHIDDIPKGKKVLLIDDLIATGGTIAAAAELLKEGGAEVNDIFCVIGLPFLEYEEKLPEYRIQTLVDFESE